MFVCRQSVRMCLRLSCSLPQDEVDIDGLLQSLAVAACAVLHGDQRLHYRRASAGCEARRLLGLRQPRRR